MWTSHCSSTIRAEGEAEQIFTAVEKNLENQEDVWYMVADNEGHGFRKKENINAYQEAMVQFWKKYLILTI